MSLTTWWAGRHERRRNARVLNDLATWHLRRVGGNNPEWGIREAKRDLRLQELGVPETAEELAGAIKGDSK